MSLIFNTLILLCIFIYIGRERENKENEKNLSEDGAGGENRNFRPESRGSRRGTSAPRYNGRSRGTRMFQNSERGNSGSGGGNNTGFVEPTIDTWYNPTSKDLKKGIKNYWQNKF